MTDKKRWPNHCEWARTDTIARMQKIREHCDRLAGVVQHPAMKLVVMEIKNMASETELDMVKVK